MLEHGGPEHRVLVLAPTGRDVSLVCQVLHDAGVAATACETAAELCRRIGEGAAAAVVADEALTDEAARRLASVLAGEPEWSDFPLVVMTARREQNGRVWPLLEGLGSSAHPLLLERPVSTTTLIRAVRTVLQSRTRQYQIRDQIAERKRLEGELLQKVDALAESDRRKDEFLAVLGHELRNPLAAIVNGIQVLPMLGTLDGQAATVCDLLGRQARQMTHLVDDLLDISRVSRGSVRLHVGRVDLVPLLCEVAEEYRSAADESGCALEASLPESLPVEGDPTRLRQIFGNLVHNACKFTDRGGRITVTARGGAERRTATVAVRDTGIGMSAETRARLFVPFSQAESSLDRSRSGLGLGLALVEGLVRLHGGTVTAHSGGLGEGSEFVVDLPLAAGEATGSTGAAATARAARRRAFRVLLVEDSQPVAEMLALTLRRMGHEVALAPDAAAALERIPAWRPQVVFSDISMPGMSGYDLARRIRQEPEWGDMVLVAVTGYGQPDDRERALGAGFDHHLVKPADVERMEALFDAIAD
jgi:signal transduction histidine kinase/ActR/RegA family two-component response regulator